MRKGQPNAKEVRQASDRAGCGLQPRGQVLLMWDSLSIHARKSSMTLRSCLLTVHDCIYPSRDHPLYPELPVTHDWTSFPFCIFMYMWLFHPPSGSVRKGLSFYVLGTLVVGTLSIFTHESIHFHPSKRVLTHAGFLLGSRILVLFSMSPLECLALGRFGVSRISWYSPDEDQMRGPATF